jgi:hypothetical protein
MRKATSLAVTLAGAAALTAATTATATTTANAHDDQPFTHTWQAPTLDHSVPLNADVYRAFLDAKLDKLAAYVAATRARVAAIDSDEVLTGLERRVAKSKIAKARRLGAFLGALPTTGAYAPTAAERATVAAIKADLAAIVGKLTALLANEPVVTPVTTTVAKRTTTVEATRDHVCDGRHDGYRTWDGWRDWWHHH